MNRGLAIKCPTLSELKMYLIVVKIISYEPYDMNYTVCGIPYAAYYMSPDNELKPEVVQIIIFYILKFSFDNIDRWIFMPISGFQLLDKSRR